jgi:hypothetical protein
MVGDHRGDQPDIVDVLAGAGAEPALPLRIREILIGQVVSGTRSFEA